jgi:hypothetical protein
MIDGKSGVQQVHINQQVRPPHPGGFASVGVFAFTAGQPSAVVISTEGTTGHVIADAVQLLRHDK